MVREGGSFEGDAGHVIERRREKREVISNSSKGTAILLLPKGEGEKEGNETDRTVIERGKEKKKSGPHLFYHYGEPSFFLSLPRKGKERKKKEDQWGEHCFPEVPKGRGGGEESPPSLLPDRWGGGTH